MKFLPIIIGCTYNNELKGPNNDAILMYNLFYDNEYLNCDKPILLIDKYKKIDINTLQVNLNKSENLIIYFSGHGSINGKIKISDNEFDCYEFVNLINFKKNIIFILDCCHSSEFYHPKFNFIYGSYKNEVAKECYVNIRISELKQYPLVFLDKKNKKCSVGVFTYFYFLTIKNEKKLFVGKNEIWQQMKKKYNQTYTEIFFKILNFNKLF